MFETLRQPMEHETVVVLSSARFDAMYRLSFHISRQEILSNSDNPSTSEAL